MGRVRVLIVKTRGQGAGRVDNSLLGCGAGLGWANEINTKPSKQLLPCNPKLIATGSGDFFLKSLFDYNNGGIDG